MTVRAVEGKKPYTGGKAIEITDDKVINLKLRDENNLIIWDEGDNEIYVDLQLPDGIRPTYAFPVGITTGRVLIADDWDVTGTIICAKTTSGDNIKVLYGDDNKLYVDNGTGIFKEVSFKADVDLAIQTLRAYVDQQLALKQDTLTAGNNIVIDQNNVISAVISTSSRFLSLWDCETGLPISFPVATPFVYETGDHFLVENVDTTTNYRPEGIEFDGTASTTVETKDVEVGDMYYFDGTSWLLQQNHNPEVSFSQIAGQPTDNTNLALALGDKANVTDVLTKTNTTTYTPTADYHPATKKYVDDNAVAFKAFPNTFDTTHTTQDFLDSIVAESLPVGSAYLGQVSLSDMPSGVTIQGDVEVYVYPQNIIYAVMKSTDVSPYEWIVNSQYNRGWEPTNTDTTYSAGTGLTLSGTTFSADTTVLATKSDIADLGGFTVVSTLPSVDSANEKSIYFLGPSGTGGNKYEEWVVQGVSGTQTFTGSGGTNYTPNSITLTADTLFTFDSLSGNGEDITFEGTDYIYMYSTATGATHGWYSYEIATHTETYVDPDNITMLAGTYSVYSNNSSYDSIEFTTSTKQWVKTGERSYIASYGIDISNQNEISVDTNIVATQSDISGRIPFVPFNPITYNDFQIYKSENTNNQVGPTTVALNYDGIKTEVTNSNNIRSSARIDVYPDKAEVFIKEQNLNTSESKAIDIYAGEIQSEEYTNGVANSETYEFQGGGNNQIARLKDVATKQDTLVNQTNIKSINNNSLLGSGDLSIAEFSPGSGSTGDVLTKTSNGYEWSTPASAPVSSVNSQTGAVVLDADDISDSTTTNKFVTATEKSTWNGKQDALAPQTDYTSKGTSTKVPTITTNTLGQVTAITETSISFPVSSVNGNTGAVSVSEFNPGGTATTGYVVTKTASGYEWAQPSGGDVMVSTQTGNQFTPGMKIWGGASSDLSQLTQDLNTLYMAY